VRAAGIVPTVKVTGRSTNMVISFASGNITTGQMILLSFPAEFTLGTCARVHLLCECGLCGIRE
jgi:hypothetical protein